MEVVFGGIVDNLFEIAIACISLVVSYYIIPCIENDLVPWLKEKRLYEITKRFVNAAEKMASSGLIDKKCKKDTVIKLLQSNGIVVDDTLNAFIESACKELDLITNTLCEEISAESKQ